MTRYRAGFGRSVATLLGACWSVHHIPCERAWSAVEEFIVSDGELPQVASFPQVIEWIGNQDLPADTFPEP
jgi:hypothetical protein